MPEAGRASAEIHYEDIGNFNILLQKVLHKSLAGWP
jgi:hypothetical protein